MPAYVVFPDRTLAEMAVRRPKSPDALGEIRGVGPVKIEKYGEQFLDVLRSADETEAADSTGSASSRLASTFATDIWTTASISPSSTSPCARWSASSRATKSRPSPRKLDADAKFPWENIRKMGELGLLGVPWSEELGGAGLDLLSFMIVDPRAGQGRRVARTHDLRAHDARHVADRELRHRGAEAALRAVARVGSVLGGFGLTEPDAGSDAGGTRTTAVRKNGHYVLNGTKRFITHGGVGEIFIVTAVTDPSKGTKGISSFILTKPTNDLESREGRRHRSRAVARRR